MTNKYSVLSVAAIYGVLISLTLAVYFLTGLNNSEMHLIAFGFVLFAEFTSGLSMAALINGKGRTVQVLNLSAGMTISITYVLVSIISAMFSDYFADHINLYILIQIFIIAITLLISILIAAISKRIDLANKKENHLQNIIMDYELKLYNMAQIANNTLYKNELNQLFENLKYSDKNSLSSVDEKLFQLIEELEIALKGSEEVIVRNLIKNISECINQRKQEILQSKRGGS